MKDHHDITATIEQVPVEACVLSDLNPRRDCDPDSIDRLAENIRRFGLIHNLAGLRQADGTVAIVAGGRRLRALQSLQDDRRFEVVPVVIAPSADTARHWAVAENHLRENLHPADEIESYRAMAKKGATVPEIAVAFGVGERHVYRRLALSELPDPVLDALRQDKVTLGMAACFTVASDEALALDVLERVSAHPVSERQIKAWLQPDAVQSKDRRACFVGEAAYLKAGGRVTKDLFDETDFWSNMALLDSLFEATLSAKAEALRESEGWLWAEVETTPYVGWHEIEARKCDRLYPEPGRLSDADEARLEALVSLADMDDLSEVDEAELERLQVLADGHYTEAQKAHAGILCYIDYEGVFRVTAGLVRPTEAAAAIEAGILAPSRHGTEKDRKRPAISAALARDLEAVRRGTRQSALLDHPDLLLDLLAFQLGQEDIPFRLFALRTDSVETEPTTETGYSPDPRLSSGINLKRIDDPMAAFQRFRKRSKAKRHEELARVLAALVDPMNDNLADWIDDAIKLDRRSRWTPTAENVFGRVSAGYLVDLWQEVLGLDASHPTATTFAKLKKREKAEKLEVLFSDPEVQEAHCLSDEQQERISTWWPDTAA